jgi:hypothetical protein
MNRACRLRERSREKRLPEEAFEERPSRHTAEQLTGSPDRRAFGQPQGRQVAETHDVVEVEMGEHDVYALRSGKQLGTLDESLNARPRVDDENA